MKRPCPQCQQSTLQTSVNSHRPFCCERCKLIDLGDWLSERNRIESTELPLEDDLMSADDWQH